MMKQNGSLSWSQHDGTVHEAVFEATKNHISCSPQRNTKKAIKIEEKEDMVSIVGIVDCSHDDRY